MLQKSPSICKRPSAVVATPVKTNITIAVLLVICRWLELKGCDIVNDLNDLDRIAFRILRKRKAQWEFVRFEAHDLSCRVKEGPLKEDDTLEIFFFLVGHVLEHSIPETEIKQEFAAVTALDLFAVVIFYSH